MCICIHVFVIDVFLLHTLTLGKVQAPIPATVTAGAPTAARVLLKQRSEDPSIGRSSASTGLATGSPTTPSEDTSVVGRRVGNAAGDAEDDHSDKGTYTIELENRNPEEEEARRMIDKVGVWTSTITIRCLDHIVLILAWGDATGIPWKLLDLIFSFKLLFAVDNKLLWRNFFLAFKGLFKKSQIFIMNLCHYCPHTFVMKKDEKDEKNVLTMLESALLYTAPSPIPFEAHSQTATHTLFYVAMLLLYLHNMDVRLFTNATRI